MQAVPGAGAASLEILPSAFFYKTPLHISNKLSIFILSNGIISMKAPAIESSTPQERRQFIREKFPCMNNCRVCGLCAIFHNKDAEDVYADYINGTRTFEDISEEYKPNR